MKKQTILLVSVIVLVFVSALAVLINFNQESEKSNYASLTHVTNIEKAPHINIANVEGYILMKANCYICHNPDAVSHDAIIVPPFKAVKMHYTRQYNNKDEFVDAVVNWVQEPSEDKALMRGAVEQFEVMPKMTLEKIAGYLYDNDVDEPEWMGKHMKEEKGKMMGKGQGKGMGKDMKYN